MFPGEPEGPLSQLLTSEDMTLNQRFQLSNSGPNSTIKMKIALWVLHLEKRERPPDHQHSAQVKRPSVSKEEENIRQISYVWVSRPWRQQHSSIHSSHWGQ